MLSNFLVVVAAVLLPRLAAKQSPAAVPSVSVAASRNAIAIVAASPLAAKPLAVDVKPLVALLPLVMLLQAVDVPPLLLAVVVPLSQAVAAKPLAAASLAAKSTADIVIAAASPAAIVAVAAVPAAGRPAVALSSRAAAAKPELCLTA